MIIVIKFGVKVIGVNNCNLENFEVDFGIMGCLKEMVFKDIFLFVFSGINSYQDVFDCKRDGINGIFVGEVIMCVFDVFKFIREFCVGFEVVVFQSVINFMFVKICGICFVEVVMEVIKVGVDFVGMIFVFGMKWCVFDEMVLVILKVVYDVQIIVGEVVKFFKLVMDFFFVLVEFLRKYCFFFVGVFMNQFLEEVFEKQRLYNFDIV